MKKIKAPHENNARIICISTPGQHDFYYQSPGSKTRYWLARCPYSGSVFAYFRDNGRFLCQREYSLTLGQLYAFRKYRNTQLARVLRRLPGQIDYVLSYCAA